MANRYIDTGFYKSPFVRSLKGSLKGLYSFIICDCTGAGIWVKDLEIASAYIGFEITETEFLILINSGKAIDLKNGKFFFPDFIEHQYPKGLCATNPAHNNFIIELKKYNLIDENLKVLESPFKGTNVMVMDNAIVNAVVSKPKVPKKEIPTIVEFLEYCKTIEGINYQSLEFSFKAKYESWAENDWKDGNNKEIKNWKSKIKNVIPFLKPSKVEPPKPKVYN